MNVPAIVCLAVAVPAVVSIPFHVFADPTVDTYLPAWADHLPLTTAAALLLLLGGNPVHDDYTPDEPRPVDPAKQAAAEDGYTNLARYFAHRPFPQQQDRRAA